MATAAGAVIGSVIASGCQVSTGTVIGGLLGGLLGSQVGGGNGKNAAAGAGAAIGAWLGSDCSPVATATAPVALPGPPFRFNGLVMAPVTGFPLEAFRGVPPIVTTNDLSAARTVVKGLAAGARESYKAGDTETAMLKMYWAKRIGLVALSVTGASLDAISSMKQSAGKGAVSARIPAKTLVVLPAFDQVGKQAKNVASIESAIGRVASLDMKNGFAVADNGASGLFGVLGSLGKVIGVQVPGVAGVPGQGGQGAAVPVITPEMLSLKDGEVLLMPNGLYVMKSLGNLTVYNPGDQAADLPVGKLDYIPRTPVPTAARQAAAPLMVALNDNHIKWAFNDYIRQVPMFLVKLEAPNRVVDANRGGVAVTYVDASGFVTNNRSIGESQYKQDQNFRVAMNLMTTVGRAPAIINYLQGCKKERLGVYGTLEGEYAAIINSTLSDSISIRC